MTFRIPIRDVADIASAMLVLFTAPEGQWAKNSRLVYSRPIPVVDPDPGYSKYLKETNYHKSWIAVDWSPLEGQLTEGDKIEIPVEYYLDPAEHYRATTLKIEALGPRVPKPGRRQPVSFENTQHLWYGEQSVKIEPGRGKHLFPFIVPKASSQNDLLLLALFSDGRGKRWPWDVRAGAWFSRKGGYFELETDKPGNLFTREEPVRIVVRLKNVRPAGGKKTLNYKVYDYTKALVAQGSVPFNVEQNGQKVQVALDLARQGTFLFQAEVEGWEARETTFCRIPDLAAITGGKPTRLGFTVHNVPQIGFRTAEMIAVARRLGLTNCRAFTEWKSIEPGPRHYALQHWDRFFEAAHHSGVETIMTIYDPPAWVMPKGQKRRLPDVRLRPGCLSRDGNHRIDPLQGETGGLGMAQRDHAGRTAGLRVGLRETVPCGRGVGPGGRPGSAVGSGGRVVAAGVPVGGAQRRRRQVRRCAADPLRQRLGYSGGPRGP